MEQKFTLKTFLVCVRNGSALMQKGAEDDGKVFYRPLGGHIEAFEKSDTALRREMDEEIHTAVRNLKLIDVIENIFMLHHKRTHEIVFLYSGELEKRDLYNRRILDRDEDGEKTFAYWVSREELAKARLRVYPTGVYKHITRMMDDSHDARSTREAHTLQRWEDVTGSELLKIVRHWFPLRSAAKFRRMNKGYASLNWVFDYNGKKYMLKRFLEHATKQTVNSEYRILNYTKKKDFPYEVPSILVSKENRPYLEYEGGIYAMYTFLNGIADKPVTPEDARDIGTMTAKLHDIFGAKRFVAEKPKGYETVEDVIGRLDDAYETARKSKEPNAKLFVECCDTLLPKAKRLELGYYRTQKAYPIHADIAPDNILWQGGRVRALIDFSNMATYRDSLLMDIAWAVHFCCINKQGYGYRTDLLKAFFSGYSSIRRITKRETEEVFKLVTITNLSDLEFAYQNSGQGSKLEKYMLKMGKQVINTKWLLEHPKLPSMVLEK